MPPPKVKCFVGNFDARHQGLVVALNQPKAAKIVGHPLPHFKRHWWVCPSGQWPIADPKPNKFYIRTAGGSWQERKSREDSVSTTVNGDRTSPR